MSIWNRLFRTNALQHGRAKHRRRRHSRSSNGLVAAEIGMLEPRLLLAATVISELPDVSMLSPFRDQYVPLGEHFDDTAITGHTVEVATALGNFVIETFDTITPTTAQNFIDLTAAGNYDDMFFHRSVPGFVLQGGGFAYPEAASQLASVVNNGTIINEFDNWFDPNLGGLEAGTPLNVRGTVAMARVGGQEHSATSQWFVNVDDNASDLDGVDGGFTVFGRVLYDGMTAVDAIVDADIVNAGGVFATLPVIDYTSGQILRDNLVFAETSIVPELNFEVTANTGAEIVNATIVDGQLRLAGTPGVSGTATITVTATDLNGTSVSSTIDVVVPLSSAVVQPGPGGNVTQPTIEWLVDSNATTYELWVNQVDGTNRIIHQTGLTGNSFTPSEDLPIGTYHAWVRPVNDDGAGVWSDLHSFRVGLSEVTITSPDGGFVNTPRPVIEWTAAATATEYDLWVNHVGVQNQVIRETSLSGTTFTPSSDLEDGVYRVWVKAKNSAEESNWSLGVTFEVSTAVVPQFTGPNQPATTARPTLTWAGGDDDTYELWVNQIGGTVRVIHDEGVTGNSYFPTTDLANGNYRAWVRHRPAASDGGPWSAAFEFTVATAPSTIQITDVTGTDSLRPTLSWPAANLGVRYELWVNDIDNGVARVIWLTDLTELEFTATEDLTTGSYRAWIRAFSAGNIAGEWSAAYEFTLA
ncbi:peptidylprolyl isomerase [Fuerstiella marisgermanici]|uniref:peptidylprolyl isomerase n=1 Tax=Fuerstiella marisgermanici TaxID=1891926 RepID=A0A1P8WEN5_9PLAN|nr:peptidylprolyl isomerase [Fuerstiella marisgermanici]APZ92509.1 Peptidyl-prolyl cis-trans isomerase A precursor [Fuerstiella marisgermanici]